MTIENVLTGKHLAFRGEDKIAAGAILIEVTDCFATGVVEIAFDRGRVRHYLSFDVVELIRIVHGMERSEP